MNLLNHNLFEKHHNHGDLDQIELWPGWAIWHKWLYFLLQYYTSTLHKTILTEELDVTINRAFYFLASREEVIEKRNEKKWGYKFGFSKTCLFDSAKQNEKDSVYLTWRTQCSLSFSLHWTPKSKCFMYFRTFGWMSTLCS